MSNARDYIARLRSMNAHPSNDQTPSWWPDIFDATPDTDSDALYHCHRCDVLLTRTEIISHVIAVGGWHPLSKTLVLKGDSNA